MTSTEARPVAHRNRTRLLAVIGGALAALVVWVIAVPIAGQTLSVTSPGQPSMDVTPPFVIFAALVQSLLGWALLALLERFSSRGRTIWLVIAVVVLLLSFIQPAVAADDTTTLVVLSLMHVVVAAVVIPTFTRTSSRR